MEDKDLSSSKSIFDQTKMISCPSRMKQLEYGSLAKAHKSPFSVSYKSKKLCMYIVLLIIILTLLFTINSK